MVNIYNTNSETFKAYLSIMAMFKGLGIYGCLFPLNNGSESIMIAIFLGVLLVYNIMVMGHLPSKKKIENEEKKE